MLEFLAFEIGRGAGILVSFSLFSNILILSVNFPTTLATCFVPSSVVFLASNMAALSAIFPIGLVSLFFSCVDEVCVNTFILSAISRVLVPVVIFGMGHSLFFSPFMLFC